MNNNEHRNLFCHFVQQKYTQLIDDFAVLTKISKEKLYEIQESLINDGNVKGCDINKCDFAMRHGNNNNDKNTLDATLNFYKITMDSLHFYMFHLFECGFRAIETNESNNNKMKENKNNSEYFDAVFAKVSNYINDRKHITAVFDRFKSNNKFDMAVNISNTTAQFDAASGEKGITYMDELCQYLSKKLADNEAVIAELLDFAVLEEYDSEAISGDVMDEINETNSNIFKIIKKRNLIEFIRKFVNDRRKSVSSFSIGFRFYYWEYYKTMKQMSMYEQCTDNINDHSGFDICDLYIKKKYNTFKEEISNYKYISFNQYTDLVVTKAKIYESKDIVKAVRRRTEDGRTQGLHYGISEESKLGFQNLVSLIFYTDFSDHCKDFSSTFRRTNEYESISLVKARNRKYYWMSRILRETVELFGEWCSNRIPVYTGISVVIPIPNFRIRLCAPTSTSPQIEVTTLFSGEDGMVLQLCRAVGNYLSLFNCSCLSRYKEEDERLFFGGHWTIRIQTVIHRKTHENFSNFIGPLLYLDAMLSASRPIDVKGIKITSKEIKIISSLMQWKVENHKPMGYDQYIYNTFECFCKQKTQIDLHLYYLGRFDKGMTGLIINAIEKREYKKDMSGKTNLFRKQVLNVFENVKTITIKCNACPLSMLDMLALIEPFGVERIIIRTALRNKLNHKIRSDWINNLTKSNEWENEIKPKYKQNKYQIFESRDQKYRYLIVNEL